MTKKDLLTVFRKTNGYCFYCNALGEVVDHFLPKKELIPLYESLGWDKKLMDKPENLFLACRDCNSKKAASFPEDFTRLGFWVWNRYDRANRRVGLFVQVF